MLDPEVGNCIRSGRLIALLQDLAPHGDVLISGLEVTGNLAIYQADGVQIGYVDLFEEKVMLFLEFMEPKVKP